jgi:hypothetical protein
MLRWMKVPLLCATLVAVGCGSDSPSDEGNNNGNNNNNAGSFQVTVSGATSASFSGVAVFGSLTGQGFAMTLSSLDGQSGLVVYRAAAGRPGTGTLQLGNLTTTTELWATGFLANGSISFTSTSGTINISTSNNGSLVGTLQFQGQGNVNGTPGNVTVNATFNATCASGAGLNCS